MKQTGIHFHYTSKVCAPIEGPLPPPKKVKCLKQNFCKTNETENSGKFLYYHFKFLDFLFRF